MACSIASSSGEQFNLNLVTRHSEHPWNSNENLVSSHSAAPFMTYSLKMQLREGPATHFGWPGSKMSIGRAFPRLTNSSFGDDLNGKQTMEHGASFNASLLSECSNIVVLGSPCKGFKTLICLRCSAKSPGSAFLDQSTTTITEPVEKKDGDALAAKEPSRRTAPMKRVPHLRKGKPSKSNVSSMVSRQGTGLKLSTPESNGCVRARLEQLGLAEPALFKYMEQAASADLTVDDIVSSVSSLMGITRVGWSEAIAILSKFPSLLKAEPSMLKDRVAFLMELGMNQDILSEVLALHPALLEYNLDEMRLIVDYLISVGVSNEEFPGILIDRPQVLSNKAEEVRYTIGCLMQAGVPSRDLTRVLTKVPELFSPITRKNLKSRIEFFKQVGLDGGALSKGIARRPNLLNFDLDSMKQTHEYLSEFMSPSDVSKLVRRFAEVLVLDPKRKMEPIVNHLLRLGVKRQSLGKVLLRRPQLLGYTVAGLEPTIQYLKELGVKENLLGKVISISPQVLTLNCEEKLKPVIEYLRSIGLEQEGDMERLLVRNAQLLCCSIDKNIRPKFDFFLNMGLANKDVIRIMVLFPSMFGQSIDGSLAPKYHYLIDVMKRSPTEIVDFPQYFGYSLEKRIKPRFEKLAARGIQNISLPSMLACVEGDFTNRYLVGTPPTRAPYNVKKIPRKSKYADM